DEFALSLDEDESEEDEFALSFGGEDATAADELSESSFGDEGEDEVVGDVAVSEGSGEVDSADSFFGFEEESLADSESAGLVEESDSDEEFALSLDEDESDEDEPEEDEFALSFAGEDATAADELSEFSFGDAGEDDAGEDEVVGDVAVSEGSGEVDSADSFFGFEEESLADSESPGLAEESDSDEEFALSLDEDESDEDELEEDEPEEDEFALSFGGEDATAADELSESSFGDAGEDEVVADVAGSEGSGEVDSTDSFFGFEEESLADSESAGLAEESDSDDEFSLSLDEDELEEDESDEDEFALSFGGEDATAADELSEFSFGDAGEDDAGEDEVVADVAVSEDSEDEFALALDGKEELGGGIS
ncbi:MAG: hypothetical protein D3908_15575, partial [Candidatus Electrothrix sp. AUS4]|nr:hypothetical protein [Candidatus Electrothrix sp. AUS4]